MIQIQVSEIYNFVELNVLDLPIMMYKNYSSIGHKYYGLDWSETTPIRLLRSLPSGLPNNVAAIPWEAEQLKKVLFLTF